MPTNNQSTPQTAPLLPDYVWRAPIDLWKNQKLEALVFLVVNLLFGTVGLWLPPLNAVFGPSTAFSALLKQLDDGAFYMYVITFLSAIGGVTFTSIASEKVEHSRNLKVVLAGSVVVTLFVCAILLQAQVFMNAGGGEPSEPIRVGARWVQILVALLTTLLAIYVFSIVVLEESGSAKDDLDRGAEQLLDRARGASASPDKGAWKP